MVVMAVDYDCAPGSAASRRGQATQMGVGEDGALNLAHPVRNYFEDI
jgi:hypothetical protein